MGRVLVTVITPVLNRVETIGSCLDSVTRQTYQPLEHIVVDGGSTDGTLELLRGYSPSHDFRWVSERDSGMYEAINRGMALARGDVIAYLNSDDFYLPWSVEVAVRALRSGVDLVYGDLGILRTHLSHQSDGFYMQFYPDFDLRYYSFVGTIAQPTVFWRRSLMERLGPFDTRYRLIGDCEYWLRAAMGGAKLRHISELMAVQVDHGSTLRETQTVRLREEFYQLRRAMETAIDPPSSLRWERFKGSAGWRVHQLEFFCAMKLGHPTKWPYFVRELQAHDVDLRLRDLRVLAPQRWRGDASLFEYSPRLHDVLGARVQL
jgi:glycosyltransferase involved in cell wall biosynthesis